MSARTSAMCQNVFNRDLLAAWTQKKITTHWVANIHNESGRCNMKMQKIISICTVRLTAVIRCFNGRDGSQNTLMSFGKLQWMDTCKHRNRLKQIIGPSNSHTSFFFHLWADGNYFRLASLMWTHSAINHPENKLKCKILYFGFDVRFLCATHKLKIIRAREKKCQKRRFNFTCVPRFSVRFKSNDINVVCVKQQSRYHRNFLRNYPIFTFIFHLFSLPDPHVALHFDSCAYACRWTLLHILLTAAFCTNHIINGIKRNPGRI